MRRPGRSPGGEHGSRTSDASDDNVNDSNPNDAKAANHRAVTNEESFTVDAGNEHKESSEKEEGSPEEASNGNKEGDLEQELFGPPRRRLSAFYGVEVEQEISVPLWHPWHRLTDAHPNGARQRWVDLLEEADELRDSVMMKLHAENKRKTYSESHNPNVLSIAML